jgi:hypothetical protein
MVVEFDNSNSRTFFLTHGAHLRMSCPYTFAQNGKAEHIIRTVNNMVRSLLFQACIPPTHWAEALHTTTHLLNILPTKTLQFSTLDLTLFSIAPVYDHLRLSLLSKPFHHSHMQTGPSVYPLCFPGIEYQCLDLDSNRISICRHVIFDESTFPLAKKSTPPAAIDFDFLDTDDTSVLPP